MRKISVFIALICLVFAGSAWAMEGMDNGNGQNVGFVHSVMVDGVHTEFKVMDLASMHIKDAEGRTHHVMVTFMRDNTKITKVAGKVKLVSPSGKTQVADLKDYGSGVFAAMFTVDEPGKWGVICVFKEAGGSHTVKFWYPHMVM